MPIVQSIREAGDVGRPAALQNKTAVSDAFEEVTRNTVSELIKKRSLTSNTGSENNHYGRMLGREK